MLAPLKNLYYICLTLILSKIRHVYLLHNPGKFCLLINPIFALLQAFSKNGEPTIVTKDPAYRDKIGLSKQLAFSDIKIVNLMYNCAGRTIYIYVH